MHRFMRLGLAQVSVVACFLNACAYSYVDPGGTQHIIGMVKVEIPPTGDHQTLVGDVVEVSSLGVAFHSTVVSTSFTVGYNRQVTAALRNHAFINGNPLTAVRTDYLKSVDHEARAENE